MPFSGPRTTWKGLRQRECLGLLETLTCHCKGDAAAPIANSFPPVGDAREGDVEEILVVEELVDNLVHVRQRKAAVSLPQAHLAVVIVQRLQILVHLQRPPHQSQVKCP